MAGQRRRHHGQPPSPRGRRSPAVVLFTLVGALALVGGVGYGVWDTHSGSDPALDARLTPDGPAADAAVPLHAPSATPSAGGTAAHPATPTPDVPTSGTGRFSTAQADGEASGKGRVRRYKVEVEGGISVSPRDAAHEIAGILADPRGWTRDGHDAFQLVSSGQADFVVKIATPDTVDAICGAAGLQTEGEVNCDVGATVVVNLKRWMLGSPQFAGPIHDYRALIINHEVGHRIGHGHEGCPGSGKPAPVMMQQIKGLHGCVANAWPYDSHGRYLQGPPA